MAKLNAPGKAAVGGKSDLVATHLAVTSRRDGFRRAGRAWSAETVTVAVADFSPGQIEQLLAEPMLTVVPVAESGK